MIGKRLLFAIPSLIGVVIVTFLLTRALPGDPAAYFAGPAADKAGDRADQEEARPRQAADRAVLPLHRRSRAWRFRQFADHRPAGRDRNPQPPAGFRRTDPARPDRLDRDRDSARHSRRDQAGLVDRPSLPGHDHGRRVVAGVLHRPGAGLCLLFPARMVAGAARAARRVLQRAADGDRLLSDRRADRARFRGVPLRAQPADPAGADACDLLAGADRAHDAGLDAGGAVVRFRAHRARQRAVAAAR